MIMLSFKFKRKIEKRAPLNYSEVNIFEDNEVNWWCQELKCTEEELTYAVDKVGVYTTNIKKYLGAY